MSSRVLFASVVVAGAFVSGAAWAQSSGSVKPPPMASLVEDEATIAVRQPGPHEGGGQTTAFPFFARATDFKMAFRKRILHKGSAIGYHLQEFDEVYYILSGTGEYTLNGVKRQVGPGTAMLTRPGDSHGLRPTGDGELSLLITYATQGSQK
jgi:mannose-6-phosphate isomerase-like protein (cupin superfamily)